MSRHRPELFKKVAQLEEFLNERRREYGQNSVRLTRFNIPIEEAIEQYERQGELFNDYDGPDVCESGHCWT